MNRIKETETKFETDESEKLMSGMLDQLKGIRDVQEIMVMNEREFKAMFGVAPQAFVKLLGSFAESEAELKQQAAALQPRARQRQAGGGRKHTLPTPASRLGFILHYCKRYDTLDALGDRAGFHRSNASRSVQWLLPVLLHTLAKLNVLPKREFATPAELEAALAGIESLVIDATERPILRPQAADAQKAAYSGKNHQHSLKNTIISSLRRQILFLGYTAWGSRHDYGLFKTEFALDQDWFAKFKIWVDLGYLGFADDYKTLELHLPHKKPRKSKANPHPSLADEQKAANRALSQVRIVVEHVIASLKHWSILTTKFRNHLDQLEDQVILAAAGLHNFLLAL